MGIGWDLGWEWDSVGWDGDGNGMEMVMGNVGLGMGWEWNEIVRDRD